MDFKGQKLAELILSRLLFLFGAVSFVVGYFEQEFMHMVYINGAGLALACLITLPDWPWFNKHPIKFLQPLSPPITESKKDR